ncbi:MAG: TRAP transporter small permease [Pseudomonadota bacterium]
MNQRLCHLIDRICGLSGGLTAVYVAALAVLSLAEIISRNVLSYSIPFAVEYAGYLVILVLTTGLGWALNESAHIRVSLVLERLAPPWRQRLDLAASLVGLCVSCFFAYALWTFAIETTLRGTVSYFPSQTPLAIPQLLMTIGPTVLALAFCGRILRLHRGGAAS